MTAQQTQAFMQLLDAWNRREDARSHGSITELAAARTSLDEVRVSVKPALVDSLH